MPHYTIYIRPTMPIQSFDIVAPDIHEARDVVTKEMAKSKQPFVFVDMEDALLYKWKDILEVDEQLSLPFPAMLLESQETFI